MVDWWRCQGIPAAVRNARDFAIEAHRDQRYGKYPYIYHLDAVAEIILQTHDLLVEDMIDPERVEDEVIILAYLHDVLEDVPSKTWMGISSRFGDKVGWLAEIVRDCEGYPRALRKKDTNEKLRNVKPEHSAALIVKAADRLANVRFSVKTKDAKSRSMLKRYRKEHEAFRAAAFRPGLCDPIWEEMDGIMLLGPTK